MTPLGVKVLIDLPMREHRQLSLNQQGEFPLKSLLVVVLFALSFSLYAFAQNSPVAGPVANAVATAVPSATSVPVAAQSAPAAPMSAGLIGILIAVVLSLNSILSAVQKIFSSLAKTEPGWLQSFSSIVLSVAKFLGSNPDAPSTPPKQ